MDPVHENLTNCLCTYDLVELTGGYWCPRCGTLTHHGLTHQPRIVEELRKERRRVQTCDRADCPDS